MRLGVDRAHLDRFLHGSANNVVRTGWSVSGNRPRLTLYISETLSPFKIKLNTSQYVRRNSLKAKTHHQPIKGSTYTLYVSFFYFVRVLSPRPAKMAQLILTIIRQTTRSRARKCLLGVTTHPKTSKRFILPKKKTEPGIRISSLKQNHEQLFSRSCSFC
jgi:hypothetical protein